MRLFVFRRHRHLQEQRFAAISPGRHAVGPAADRNRRTVPDADAAPWSPERFLSHPAHGSLPGAGSRDRACDALPGAQRQRRRGVRRQLVAMELRDAMQRRRMVRRYAGRPLPAGLVDELAAAALRAPSAGFTQAVSLLICESETDRDSFWSAAAPEGAGRWLEAMRTAPALLQVWTSEQAYLDRYAEPDKGWTDRDPGRWSAPYWWVDAGMASMLILLAAVDSSLGASFFGIPTDRIPAVRAAFTYPTSSSAWA